MTEAVCKAVCKGLRMCVRAVGLHKVIGDIFELVHIFRHILIEISHEISLLDTTLDTCHAFKLGNRLLILPWIPTAGSPE